MRKVALLAAITALAWVPAGSAFASSPNGSTVTETQLMHGTWSEPGDTNPCTGDTVTVNVTGNGVAHVTYFTNSDEFWATFTETGTGSFVDKGVIYTGHFTVWGGANGNEQNGTSTFTFSLRLTGSDGSTVSGHETMHVTFSGEFGNSAPVVSFDKMNFTCG